jgi:putative transcriptional regulator
MTETHVIDDELLLSYAAGAVEEPVAVLVATHLALNPAARGRYRRLEALGGAMIEEIEPEPLAQGTLDAVLVRRGPAAHSQAADSAALA